MKYIYWRTFLPPTYLKTTVSESIFLDSLCVTWQCGHWLVVTGWEKSAGRSVQGVKMESNMEDGGSGEEAEREDGSQSVEEIEYDVESESSIDDQRLEHEKGSEQEESQYKQQSKAKFRGKFLKVTCGFPGCNAKPMLEQNFKAHQVTVHKKIRLTKGQKTLDCFLLGGRRKRGPDNDERTFSITEEAADDPDALDVEQPHTKKFKHVEKYIDIEKN